MIHENSYVNRVFHDSKRNPPHRGSRLDVASCSGSAHWPQFSRERVHLRAIHAAFSKSSSSSGFEAIPRVTGPAKYPSGNKLPGKFSVSEVDEILQSGTLMDHGTGRAF